MGQGSVLSVPWIVPSLQPRWDRQDKPFRVVLSCPIAGDLSCAEWATLRQREKTLQAVDFKRYLEGSLLRARFDRDISADFRLCLASQMLNEGPHA